MRGNEIPNPISIKFCSVLYVPDTITYANFGDDWLRGLRVATSEILHFSIDFRRRLYNTLELQGV